MAYSRRSYRRYPTRRYRKKPEKPMRYKVADTAYKAYQGVQYLKGLVNAELHAFDNIETSRAVGTGGYVQTLNNIPIGDTNGDRTGNSLLAKYLFGRIHATRNTAATNTFIRVMIVQDTQQISDSAPAISDVLQTVNVLSPLNKNTFNRFKVLKDMTIRLDDNQTSDNYKINIKLPFHCHYNGSLATDIQKNGLYVMYVSNEAANAPFIDHNLRFSFYDN